LTIGDLVRPEWVRLRLTAATAAEVIDTLSAGLEASGAVKPSFAPAVKEREQRFPTGLPTSGIKVALPHTDVVHVLRPAVAVATLEHPVTFHVMGSIDPAETVAVKVVFLMAIADPSRQVEALGQLVDIVQQEELLDALLRSADPAEVCRLIQAVPGH
jgi:galactitol PTS system EIIA component